MITENLAPAGGSGVFIDDGATTTLDGELLYHNGCPSSGASEIYIDGLNHYVKTTVIVSNSHIYPTKCDNPEVNSVVVEQSFLRYVNTVVSEEQSKLSVDEYSSVVYE